MNPVSTNNGTFRLNKFQQFSIILFCLGLMSAGYEFSVFLKFLSDKNTGCNVANLGEFKSQLIEKSNRFQKIINDEEKKDFVDGNKIVHLQFNNLLLNGVIDEINELQLSETNYVNEKIVFLKNFGIFLNKK
jgi:hypothetical protein